MDDAPRPFPPSPDPLFDAARRLLEETPELILTVQNISTDLRATVARVRADKGRAGRGTPLTPRPGRGKVGAPAR